MQDIDSLKGHAENISPANNPPKKWGEDSVSQHASHNDMPPLGQEVSRVRKAQLSR